MEHPFKAAIKRLNPPVSPAFRADVLHSLMRQWSHLKYGVAWHPHTSAVLWGRILSVDPKNFRQYGPIELALLDKIAHAAIDADGWWEDDLFRSTAGWLKRYSPESEVQSGTG